MMRKCMLFLALAGAAIQVPVYGADSDRLLTAGAEARVDYEYYSTDGSTNSAESGFKGKYLALRADGMIVPGLTYSWRQRLNKMHFDKSFFDATDWLYLDYAVNRWNFQAGKLVVAMGGWEYNRPPVDIICGSIFWNNIPCYDLGVSAAFSPVPGHSLMAQVVQSPFFTREHRDMLGYNVMWNGCIDWFHALWSVNMIEYQPGRFISYIALGNKFSFGNVEVELDLMNRAASHQTYFFKDCQLQGDVAWRPDPKWRLFAKASYEFNHSGTDADLAVLDGTELTVAGGGVEFFPLNEKRCNLRLHAGCFYGWGKNTNEADVMQDKTLFLTAGITWQMDFFKLDKRGKQ